MAWEVGKYIYVPRTLIQIVHILQLSGFCLELYCALSQHEALVDGYRGAMAIISIE